MEYDQEIKALKQGDAKAAMQMIAKLDSDGELTKARMTRIMMVGGSDLEALWDAYVNGGGSNG